MSSRERLRKAPGGTDELPPGLSSMWRLCRLGFHFEPALMGTAFLLALAAALPDALLAVWFKLLGEGLLEHEPGLLRFAVVALAVSVVATWLLQTVSTRIQRRFRDKVTIALESHVARLQGTISTIAHQERPEYLDRLARDGGQRRGGARHGGPDGDRSERVVRQVAVLAATVTGRRGQHQERRDGRDDRERRGPRPPAQRPTRPDAHDQHGDDQFRGHQHLHGRQRSRPERDRVRREPADLRGDAEQPQRLACQQQQQPWPSRRRLRRRGCLALLYRRPRPVERGRGQRAHDHHDHEHHARSDTSRKPSRKFPIPV